jgi:hypothetical protein
MKHEAFIQVVYMTVCIYVPKKKNKLIFLDTKNLIYGD